MKKLFFALMTCNAFFSPVGALHRASNKPLFPFMSTLSFPHSIKHPERIGVVYKGVVYKSDPQSPRIEILESRDATEFFIVVTQELTLPKNPAITHLFTAANQPYALYKIQRITQFEPAKNEHDEPTPYYTWHIMRLESQQDVLRLPENSIVLFMDPQLVELETTTWKPDDIAIQLPTIAFKNINDEADFNALCRKMLFAIVDINFLHTNATKLSKQVAANCIISVPSTALKT